MRLYTFTNMYLSDIQRGIQTAHIVSNLYSKYYTHDDGTMIEQLDDWASLHKTIIVLNGGYSQHIQALHLLMSEQSEYPFAQFRESDEALDGALTAVGIVIPERIYDTARQLREMNGAERAYLAKFRSPTKLVTDPDNPDAEPRQIEWSLSEWDFDFCMKLNTFNLA